MKKESVFISYCSTQAVIAKEFSKELEIHGITTWYDKDKIYENVSDKYTTRIQNAIDDHEIVLFLFSKETNQREFIIEKELRYAIDKGKPIFCFPIDDRKEMGPEIKKLVSLKQWMYTFGDVKYTEAFKDYLKGEERRLMLNQKIQNNISPQKVGGEIYYNDINLFLMRIAIQRYFTMITPYGTYTQLELSDSQYSEDELIMSIVPKTLIWDIPEKEKKELITLGFFNKTIKKEGDPFYEEYLEIERRSELLQAHMDKYGNSCELKDRLEEFIKKNYNYDDIQIKELFNKVAITTAENFINEIKKDGTRFNGPMLGVYSINDVNRTLIHEQHILSIDLYLSDYFTFKFTVELYHRLRSIENKFVIEKTSDVKKYAPFLCSLGMGGFVAINNDSTGYLLWTKRGENISSGEMWHFSFDETVHPIKDICLNDNKDFVIVDNKIRVSPHHNFTRGLSEEIGINNNICIREAGIIEVGIITSDRLEIELLSYVGLSLDSSKGSIEKQMKPITDSASDGKLEIEKIQYIPRNAEASLVGRLLTPESYALFQRINAKKIFEPNNANIAKSVIIENNVILGSNVTIEDYSYLSSGCSIGDNSKIHRNIFIDSNVVIGNNVKVQNNNSIYHGVTIEDGVFIGPNVTFTNDKNPRSITADGVLKTNENWEVSNTKIRMGASLGGGSVIVCGVEVGEWAMIGAGSVVTKNVPPNALVYGNPAKIQGWVSKSGKVLKFKTMSNSFVLMYSEDENQGYKIARNDYDLLNK